MTTLGTQLVALLAAGTVAAGGLFGGDSGARPGTALVIDAAVARDGRDLVDERLRSAGAEVRLPRTSAEARNNVRYFTALDYRVVVAGPQAGAAAGSLGVAAVRAPSLTGALAAVSPSN
jgi:hypothetical protein